MWTELVQKDARIQELLKLADERLETINRLHNDLTDAIGERDRALNDYEWSKGLCVQYQETIAYLREQIAELKANLRGMMP